MTLQSLASDLRNPSTRTGTAWWATLAVTVYDAVAHHINLYNGAVLLGLAGLDIAARWFTRPNA